MVDSRSFFSEGIMNSATGTIITGEVSRLGCVHLFFWLFKGVPPGVLNMKASNCLSSWVEKNEVIQLDQPGSTWSPSCVTLECDHDRLIALKLAESSLAN